MTWGSVQLFARSFAKHELEHLGHKLGHVDAGQRVELLREDETHGGWDPKWGAPLWRNPEEERAPNMTSGPGWAVMDGECRCTTTEPARHTSTGGLEVKWTVDTGAEIHCIGQETATKMILLEMNESRELATISGKITCELRVLQSGTWGDIVVAVGPFEDNIISWRSLSGWWRMSLSHGGGLVRRTSPEDDDQTYTHPTKTPRRGKGAQKGHRGKGSQQEEPARSRQQGGIVANFLQERDNQLRWYLAPGDSPKTVLIPRWLLKRLATRRLLRDEEMLKHKTETTALGRVDCATLATELMIVPVTGGREVLADRRTGLEVSDFSIETFKEIKEKAGAVVPFPLRMAGEQCIPAAAFDREIMNNIEASYAEGRDESDEDQTVVDEDATYRD